MTVFTETWTGSNGAGWSGSWTGAAPTGGINDIQSNAGRQRTGTTVGQGPSAYYNVNTAITDFDLTITGTLLTALSTYALITFRADAMLANRGIPNNGYALVYNLAADGAVQILGFSGGAPTGLGSPVIINHFGAAGGIFRVRAVGSLLRANYWLVNAAQPTGWMIEVTEPTFTSGRIALGAEETALSASGFQWDDLSLTVPPLDEWAGLPRSTRDNYRGVR